MSSNAAQECVAPTDAVVVLNTTLVVLLAYVTELPNIGLVCARFRKYAWA